jgi:hypothetical protein
MFPAIGIMMIGGLAVFAAMLTIASLPIAKRARK